MDSIFTDGLLVFVFEFYGLSFFVMGVVLISALLKKTDFPFANHMVWLAFFGITHGILELIDGARINNPNV